MTVLEALTILEAAVLECKKRDINTPEVKSALDLLERYIWPKWLVPQFRHEPISVGFVQRQILIRTVSLTFVEERALDYTGQGRPCAP